MKDYSNYHNTDTNSKMQYDGSLIFNMALNGFEGYEVIIDGIFTKVLMTNKFSSDKGNIKYLIGNTENMKCGKIVQVDNEKWLITSIPKDFKIYKKALIQLSNLTLNLTGTITKVKIGTDSYGRPVFKEIQGDPIPIPCIVETMVQISMIDQHPINLPEGRLKVTLPYLTHNDIQVGKILNIYNEQYRIRVIDRTQVIDNEGVLTLFTDRVVT
ncbi:hypothetical protein AB1283_00575 [Bacillus sp. S13(2024)]|uniref:hypothetical protein n=1 Tax=Bacillus sp. S13(2024) TaxID=3162885 RepID=UPI003D19392D